MAIIMMGSRHNLNVDACNIDIKSEYIKDIDLTLIETLQAKRDEDYAILEVRPKLLLKIPSYLILDGMSARYTNIQQGTNVQGFYTIKVNLMAKYVCKLVDIKDYDQIVVNAILIDSYFDKMTEVSFTFDNIEIPGKYLNTDFVDLSLLNQSHDQLFDFDFKITKFNY